MIPLTRPTLSAITAFQSAKRLFRRVLRGLQIYSLMKKEINVGKGVSRMKKANAILIHVIQIAGLVKYVKSYYYYENFSVYYVNSLTLIDLFRAWKDLKILTASITGKWQALYSMWCGQII